jgi:hypothetical protein
MGCGCGQGLRRACPDLAANGFGGLCVPPGMRAPVTLAVNRVAVLRVLSLEAIAP